jgi:hypothetical protein
MTLIVTTGKSFLAVYQSQFGISILEEKSAARCKRKTAMISCRNKKMSGRSGEEFSTALFLLEGTGSLVRECQASKSTERLTQTPSIGDERLVR